MTATVTAAGGSPYRVPITRLAATHAAATGSTAAGIADIYLPLTKINQRGHALARCWHTETMP